MKEQTAFHEQEVLEELRHYLPSQAPLKDFIHHNTLHAFQHMPFHEALQQASRLFGYSVTLPLSAFREMLEQGKINRAVLERVVEQRKGEAQKSRWLAKLLQGEYAPKPDKRIGRLRHYWKTARKVDLDGLVHPHLFRILNSYLDQGISIWRFPSSEYGFLASLREMERLSSVSLFRGKRARQLFVSDKHSIHQLLEIVAGDEELFARYLFDQQFAHAGWSGMVAVLEQQPQSLLDKRKITLAELIKLELLLEIDALDTYFGQKWEPLSDSLQVYPSDLFEPVEPTEREEVLMLWQEALEWSYYDEVLMAIRQHNSKSNPTRGESFQALFCIDDRECSIRRYIEYLDRRSETFGTPGHFGLEFYYQPEHSKFYTKVCPAPLKPKYLIQEKGSVQQPETDIHFASWSHRLFSGWLISQTLGYWSAFKLFLNIFNPKMSPATASSFRHMDQFSDLTLLHDPQVSPVDGLQVGFTPAEMATRVGAVLRSIGMTTRFAPIVYVVGHGSSSVNNTHYAGYDCGACSGRPGSVNARAFSAMANRPDVRELLNAQGVVIPEETQFVGGLHDTSRDEFVFYDENILSAANLERHRANQSVFARAADLNAKERSRRFDSVDTTLSANRVHEQVRKRTVSLFEPRPELNHATNALCIVGRRDLTKNVFLDRRAFMNSYHYKKDPDGTLLGNILNAAAPVCGGINLEYYFSRVDNQKLGAGSKLPHNVMGLIGVANGVDGDLRPGLPIQMIELHDPVRLLMIVEHFPEVVLQTIQRVPATYEWFEKEWVRLVAVHPETKGFWLFADGQFTSYEPLSEPRPTVSDLQSLIEQRADNLPVFLLQLEPNR